MNFFCVGYFLLAFQLNVSFVSNYVVKLLGFLFLVGGIWEMSAYKKDYNKLLESTLVASAFSLVSVIIFSIFKVVSIPKIPLQILQVTIGSVLTIFGILIQNKIITFMVKDDELVIYTEGVKKLQSSWKMLVFFTVAGVILNVCNVIPVNVIKDISALSMAISRIIMYIFALIVLVRLIKVRNDYYKKHI